MAQDKKSNRQGGREHGTSNGGQAATSPGMSDRLEEAGHAVRRRAEEAVQSTREHYGDARQAVAQGYRRTERMIARNPGRSVMIGFGLGLGAGLLLVALCAREEETWYERHMPDRLRGMPDRLRAMSRDMPSRLRHLPEHVMERLGA